jgi:hypothetical protein
MACNDCCKELKSNSGRRSPDTIPGNNTSFRFNACKHELPNGHVIMRNEYTGKYCIGKEYSWGWQYFGHDGYEDTCDLKRDFIEVSIEYKVNGIYKPVK